jgi:hypothetical protein
MNSQDFRNLQEAYLDVVMNEEKKPLPMEKMKKKIGNIKSSMKSTIEKSANEVGMNPKRVKFPFSPDDREKYSKDEKRVANISKSLNKEETDLYDIILSHLLDEGYASTEESADKIILNMSESWFEEIVEDYVVVKKDGSREIVKGDPPKAKKEPGGYDYTHTDKQKEDMKKTPKTKIGSRFD